MQETIYSCDKCKAVVKKSNELVNVNIYLKNYLPYSKLQLDLCWKCVEKLGFVKRVVKGDDIVREGHDVSDKLYEVMVELIQETGIQVEY